jgi:hypothetical protein
MDGHFKRGPLTVGQVFSCRSLEPRKPVVAPRNLPTPHKVGCRVRVLYFVNDPTGGTSDRKVDFGMEVTVLDPRLLQTR